MKTNLREVSMHRCVVVGLIVLLALLHAQPIPAAAEPVKIRIGGSPLVPLVVYSQFWVEPIDRSLIRHHGKSYFAEPKMITATPIQMQALAAKQLDLGMLAAISFTNSIVNAKLDLKVVADVAQEGIENHNGMRYGVLKNSGINKVTDLRGKNANIFVFGGAIDMAFQAMLLKHGLDPKRDVQTIQGGFPAQAAMLREGKSHLGIFVPPFSVMAHRKGDIKFLFNATDGVGPFQTLLLAARAEVLKKHRKAYEDFFEDFVRAWNWHIDPANKQAVLAKAARMTKRPAKAYEWYGTEFDYYRAPGAMPNLEALQKNIDLAFKLGFVKARVDVSKYSDVSFVQRAQKMLRK